MIKGTYRTWKKNPSGFFIPSIEAFVVFISFLILYTFISLILTMIMLIPVIMFPEGGMETFFMIVVLIYFIFFIFYITGNFLLISFLAQGLTVTLDRGMKGHRVKIFDVLRMGTRKPWVTLGIVFVNGAIFFSIHLAIVTVLTIPLMLLSYTYPFLFIIGYFVVWLLILIEQIVLMTVLIPVFYACIVSRVKEGTGLFRSLVNGYAFVIKNYRVCLTLGLFASLAYVIGSFIPYMNYLVIGLIVPSMISVLLYSYPDPNRRNKRRIGKGKNKRTGRTIRKGDRSGRDP